MITVNFALVGTPLDDGYVRVKITDVEEFAKDIRNATLEEVAKVYERCDCTECRYDAEYVRSMKE